MEEFIPDDLAVVIPTRERWDILGETLSSLSRQSVAGFETIVVVDGTDQKPPPIQASRVLVKERAGPGAARNAGATATDRRLVMFIGDDTIPAPDLIEKHLETHNRHPEREAATVGFVDWHHHVAHNRHNRWLEWSNTQSWYASLGSEGEQEVSHWYFYTSNISLKRTLLLDGNGFDVDFPYAAFEDLECGLRLARLGLRLYYEPAAVCHHLHSYDWPALERRFACMAVSERLMVDKHPGLEPGVLTRMRSATRGHALPVERFVDVFPRRWKRLDRFIRHQADRRYHQRLAPRYLDAWDRAAELCDLRRFLGQRFDSARLVYNSGDCVRGVNGDEERLFQRARLGLSAQSDRVLARLRTYLPRGSRLLDYRCGTGSYGLRLAEAGYAVRFADYPGPVLSYVRWRLADRGLRLPVYELGNDPLPLDLDAVLCLDAEAGSGAASLLHELEEIAPTVALISAVPVEPLTSSVARTRMVARHDLGDGLLLLLYRQELGPPVVGQRA